jgi:hypothetical protein
VIKEKPRIIKMPGEPKSLLFENVMKILDNEMEYYEKNWPFYRPRSALQKFLSLFHGFQIIRRFIGGTWVKGNEFHIWLKINKHFPAEWLVKYEHEIYEKK